MTVATYSVQIGSISCHIIQAASTHYSQEQAIGFLDKFLVNVTKAEIVDYLETHQMTEYRGGYSIPYIQTSEHKIIMDTGVEPTALVEGLGSLGISPTEIDIVIISHFHPDHIGGVLDTEGNITFPQARYVVGEIEWQNYQAQGGRPGLEELLASRTQIMQANLTLVKNGEVIVSGVTAMTLPGHTLGQIGLIVEDGDNKLLFLVDSIQTLPQTSNMSWASIYDVDRELATQIRQQILTYAADENLLASAYHFPYPGLGYFSQDGKGFAWKPLI